MQASGQGLEAGKQLTVPPKAYHQYVAGNEETTVRVTLSPGDADFERLLMIMNGLGEDGGLEKFGQSPVLMAVVMGLSDAHLIGPAKQLLDSVSSKDSEALREELLAKYDNGENLRKLLGTA